MKVFLFHARHVWIPGTWPDNFPNVQKGHGRPMDCDQLKEIQVCSHRGADLHGFTEWDLVRCTVMISFIFSISIWYLYIYIFHSTFWHFDIFIPVHSSVLTRVVSKLLEKRRMQRIVEWNAARQFGQRWSQSKAAYHCWPDKSLWPWLSMCRLGPHQVWLRFGQTPGCGTPNRSCEAERQRLSWGWVKWRVMTMTQTCE